ncbi:MAG: diacylglycerol kinase family protein [Patescibacteria group bacterium]
MYVYVYDGFVTDKKHEKLLSRVETRLTDLGISGRVERLTMFKDIGEIVADAALQGCETIVAVGDDGTVGRLIDVVGMHDMSFGVIPIGDGPHEIAALLGVEEGVEACNILSRRVLHTVDLGRVNDHFFLSSVRIPRTRAAMSCNGQYSVIPTEDNEVRVCNLAPMTVSDDGAAAISSPRDGFLQTVFQPSPRRGFFSKLFRPAEPLPPPTVVPVRTLSVRHSQPVTVIRDGQRLSSSVLDISILPKRLKVITGKTRKFE